MGEMSYVVNETYGMTILVSNSYKDDVMIQNTISWWCNLNDVLDKEFRLADTDQRGLQRTHQGKALAAVILTIHGTSFYGLGVRSFSAGLQNVTFVINLGKFMAILSSYKRFTHGTIVSQNLFP
jgi:hypothetical protein